MIAAGKKTTKSMAGEYTEISGMNYMIMGPKNGKREW
jgi:hypothetical protein